MRHELDLNRNRQEDQQQKPASRACWMLNSLGEMLERREEKRSIEKIWREGGVKGKLRKKAKAAETNSKVRKL